MVTTEPKVLLVDDDEAFLALFSPKVAAQGLGVLRADSGEAALEVLEREAVDAIVSDVQMPGMSGMELFSRVQDLHPDVPFILVTSFGNTEQGIQAVKAGAFHYFEKPFFDRLDLFWTTLREALARRELTRSLDSLRREKSLRAARSSSFIGSSPGAQKVIEAIAEVARLPVTVLITGETGTGKDLVGAAIHEQSERRGWPYLAVSCTEFGEGVLESELFGHEKGAFTGSVGRRKGLFELADKGTLFLDEIGDASSQMQSKLLRVIETKTLKRMGGSTAIRSDFRLIAATNRSLADDVAAGRFRHDLFYRLNVYTIELPPLRERKDDIPLLAEFYLRRFTRDFGREHPVLSADALLALREYPWPGNVRELVNVMERAAITSRSGVITSRDLPLGGEPRVECEINDLNLKDVERYFIRLALQRTDGNKTRAAELLGVSRKTLIEKVKGYGWDETHDL